MSDTWDSKTAHRDLKVERDNSLAPGSGSHMKRVCGEPTTVHSKRTKLKDAGDASNQQIISYDVT